MAVMGQEGIWQEMGMGGCDLGRGWVWWQWLQQNLNLFPRSRPDPVVWVQADPHWLFS